MTPSKKEIMDAYCDLAKALRHAAEVSDLDHIMAGVGIAHAELRKLIGSIHELEVLSLLNRLAIVRDNIAGEMLAENKEVTSNDEKTCRDLDSLPCPNRLC